MFLCTGESFKSPVSSSSEIIPAYWPVRPGRERGHQEQCISYPTWIFVVVDIRDSLLPLISSCSRIFQLFKWQNYILPPLSVQNSLYLLHKPTDYTPILFPFPGHLF